MERRAGEEPERAGEREEPEDQDEPETPAAAPAPRRYDADDDTGSPAQEPDSRKALTLDGILRAASRGTDPRRNGEDERSFLLRTTHLACQERKLQDLHPHLSKICPKLRVLYLYDNRIEAIGTSLAFARDLTHLYLQGNDIHALGNALTGCSSLQKLYLDRNRLAVVSGLENCANLEELTLENQRRDDMAHRSLVFEPRAMEGLAGCLRVLKCANAGVADVRPLAALRSLEELAAKNNAIEDASYVAQAVANMARLHTLDATGNPCCRGPSANRAYRSAVVSASGPKLAMLDGKRVLPAERALAQRRSAR